MFPDRVDKIILDGVVNPFQYYANLETETFVDADATFEGFCKGCVENPDVCPLAKNQTAEQLQESIYTFLEQLRLSPIPIPAPGGGGTVLDYSTVKGSYLYVQLKFPSAWKSIAKSLDALMNGSESAGEGIGGGGSSEVSPSSPDALYGIKCGDTFTENQTFKDVLPVLETRINGNRIAGEISAPSICANWKLPAKERYSGDFRVKPLNPALIIGNTYDPVTPLVSARNVSETFEGSVLLQHDSYGVSLPLCSRCYLADYYRKTDFCVKCSILASCRHRFALPRRSGLTLTAASSLSPAPNVESILFRFLGLPAGTNSSLDWQLNRSSPSSSRLRSLKDNVFL